MRQNKWFVHHDEVTPPAADAGLTAQITAALDGLLKTSIPKMFDERLKPITDDLTAIKSAKHEAAPVVVPPAKTDDTKIDPVMAQQVHELTKKLTELTKTSNEDREARKAADERVERADKAMKLNAALGKQELNGPEATSAAYRLIESEIKKNQDGEWVGPNDEPLEVYVDKQLNEKHTYFLKPREVGGAGAQTGSRHRASQIQIEDIKDGMSAEQRAAAFARVLELARSN